MQEDRCPECGGEDIREDGGEKVCGGCGLVLDDNLIDRGPDWRAYDTEQWNQRARTGGAPREDLPDRGLSSEVGTGTRDARGGRVVNPAKMLRLKKWHNRSRMKGKNRSLFEGFRIMTSIGSHLNLPRQTTDAAAVMFREAQLKGLLKGHSMEAIGTACLYLASMRDSVPLGLDEFAEASMTGVKDVTKAARKVQRALGLKSVRPSARDYVEKFGTDLGLSWGVRQRTRDLLDSLPGMLKNGKPQALCGAALYVVAMLEGEPKTQGDIAKTVKITEVCLRNNYKAMVDNLSPEDRELFLAEKKKFMNSHKRGKGAKRKPGKERRRPEKQHSGLILQVISEKMAGKGEGGVSSGQIYSGYAEKCAERGLRKRSKSWVKKQIQKLDEEGFIVMVRLLGGTGGETITVEGINDCLLERY